MCQLQVGYFWIKRKPDSILISTLAPHFLWIVHESAVDAQMIFNF